MYEDEISICSAWLRYFVRQSRHFAPKPVSDYAKRVSNWSGEPVRTEALIAAASQQGYEIQGDRIKAAVMG